MGLRLLAALAILSLSSCVHLFVTHVDYAAKGAAPKVAGTSFRAEFIPRGTESGMALSAMVVGGATLGEIGPYQVRLHAFGQPGNQRAFRLTRFVLTSPGHFVAPMEKRGFAGTETFAPTATAGLTRASLLLGPSFRLEKNRDKELLLEADVEVQRQNGTWSRGTLRLPLQQAKTRRRESTFIVTEIVKDIRGKDAGVPKDPLPPPPEQP